MMVTHSILIAFIFAAAYAAPNVARAGFISRTDSMVIKFFEWFGNISIFCVQLARAAFTPPYEFREFFHQFDELGSKSLPLVMLAGAATGVVVTISTRDSMVRFGAKALLPAVVVFSIIKESGPIITALVISGRAAAGIASELSAMKVTEQIDAIEV